ncbi:MAG: Thymidylate kinase [Candidatus Westeberhardia cardiocondylae]|nr:Thymidylate kinase [Candidatus Westeberhardia cardiocondylae]
MRGKFIVLEGLEGSGKTTAAKNIVKILHANNIYNVINTKEPESTPLSKKIYALMQQELINEPITKYAELLLFYFARAQLVENIIKPALSRGTWVVGDRHDFSSQAYQGGGRKINKVLLNTLRKFILGNFYPDLILYLDVTPSIGLFRIKKKRKLDRIEKESLCFFNAVRTSYLKLVKKNKNISIVNANDTLKNVNMNIENIMINWLKKRV